MNIILDIERELNNKAYNDYCFDTLYIYEECGRDIYYNSFSEEINKISNRMCHNDISFKEANKQYLKLQQDALKKLESIVDFKDIVEAYIIGCCLFVAVKG